MISFPCVRTLTFIVLIHVLTGPIYGGDFTGEKGKFPKGWKFHKMPKSVLTPNSGLTDEFSYDGSEMVMRLAAPPPESGKVMSMDNQPPKALQGRVIEFSVWARAENSDAVGTLTIIGDKYKWHYGRTFKLSDKWRKLVARFDVPADKMGDGLFWIRIDAKSGDVLLAKPETSFPRTPEVKAGILPLINGDFSLGSYGWQMWGYGGRRGPADRADYLLDVMSRVKDAEFSEDGALKFSEGYSIRGFTVPFTRNKPITVSIWAKKDTDRELELNVALVTNDWKYISKTFKLTRTYQRYDYSGVIKPSQFDRLFIQLSASGRGDVLVKKIQLTSGDTPLPYSVPEQRAGLVGDLLIDAENRNAELTLKKNCPVDMVVKNIQGQVLRRETYPGKSECKINVNENGRRGVFDVEFRSDGKLIGSSRYAVMKDLSEMDIPDNPLAGHLSSFALFGEPISHHALQAKYLPLTNSFNRMFLGVTEDSLINSAPAVRRALSRHAYKNVVCFSRKRMPGSILDGKLLCDHELTPEIKEQYAQWLKGAISSLKSSVIGVELFNEPNLWRYKTGPRKGELSMSPERVAELYKIAYPVIKSVDPDMSLIGPCSSMCDMPYIEKFIKAGGGKAIDVLSFHGYATTPDFNDTYGNIVKLRDCLKRFSGRDIPIWNSEQYYGVRLPFLPGNTEYYRHYFTDTELEHAIVMALNIIHHAAAGSKFSNFYFQYCWMGFGDERYSLAAAPACNAAVEFLGAAGPGQRLNLGNLISGFVFPKAHLGVIWGCDKADTGITMAPPENTEIFDMFGNPVSSASTISLAQLQGPLYARFPATYDADEIKRAIAGAISGIEKSCDITLEYASRSALSALITNQTPERRTVSLTLDVIPDDFEMTRKSAEITLDAGETKKINFSVKELPTHIGARDFKVKLQDGQTSQLLNCRIPPSIFIMPFTSFATWPESAWINLNEDNLSKNFSLTERWRSPEDLSAKYICGWNAEGLAFSVIVNDDKFHAPDSAYGSWDYDSLQLYFDVFKDSLQLTSSNALKDDIEYCFAVEKGTRPQAFLLKGGSTRFIGEANKETGYDSAVKVNFSNTSPNVFRYDIFLPVECFSSTNFKTGDSFNFSMLINENDGNGRKTGLTLTPKGTQPHSHPEYYHTLVFCGNEKK